MIPKVEDLLSFTGKTVAVTGARRGIGAAIARRFAEADANVVVHYRGGAEDAAALVDDITAAGGACVSVRSELSEA
ncbi:MAG: SDR family NAD(P)-dependent oxidoreductase, partial [Hyphomicrobiales bacterium]|nr:SDR family NAD(P)-dependent oxidoreductase [Hyphomicrobiales bacterium]